METLLSLARSGTMLPWVSLCGLLAAVVIQLSPALQANMLLISAHPFRHCGLTLFTGNFVHWSWDHLLWDGLTFLVLGALFERSALACPGSRPQQRHLQMLVFLLLTAPAISLAVMGASTPYESYAGLSGLCVGLFVLVLSDIWRRGRPISDPGNLLVLAALLGLALKLAYEVSVGAALFVDASTAGFNVAVESHIAGATAGVIWAVRSRGCVSRRRLAQEH